MVLANSSGEPTQELCSNFNCGPVIFLSLVDERNPSVVVLGADDAEDAVVVERRFPLVSTRCNLHRTHAAHLPASVAVSMAV